MTDKNSKIYQWRKEKNWTLAQLAEMSNCSPQTIMRLEKGKISLSEDWIIKLAKIFECKPYELLKNNGGVEDYTHKNNPSLIYIEKFEVEGSCGDGMQVYFEDISGLIAFDSSYIKSLTASNPKQLKMIKAKGDSMFPTFRDGDPILIDTSFKDISNGGMFAINIEGSLRLKRIQYNPFSKSVKIISDNKTAIGGDRVYPDFEIQTKHEETPLTVIGKIIWSGSSHK